MALVFRGGEFIATEVLSASTLAGLSDLACRRPLVTNGLELHRQDLAELAGEAQRTENRFGPGYRVRRTFSVCRSVTVVAPPT